MTCRSGLAQAGSQNGNSPTAEAKGLPVRGNIDSECPSGNYASSDINDAGGEFRDFKLCGIGFAGAHNGNAPLGNQRASSSKNTKTIRVERPIALGRNAKPRMQVLQCVQLRVVGIPVRKRIEEGLQGCGTVSGGSYIPQG